MRILAAIDRNRCLNAVESVSPIWPHQVMSYIASLPVELYIWAVFIYFYAIVAEYIEPLEAAHAHIGSVWYKVVFECGGVEHIKSALIRSCTDSIASRWFAKYSSMLGSQMPLPRALVIEIYATLCPPRFRSSWLTGSWRRLHWSGQIPIESSASEEIWILDVKLSVQNYKSNFY